MMEIELNQDTRTSSAPIPSPSSPTNDTCTNTDTTANTDSAHTTTNNNTISKSILRKYFLCCSCKTRQINNKRRIKKNKGVRQLQLTIIPNNATDNTTTMEGDIEDSTEKDVFKSADCIMIGEEMNNPSTSWGWFITFKDGEEKWDPNG
jgi:hypothetical protein